MSNDIRKGDVTHKPKNNWFLLAK